MKNQNHNANNNHEEKEGSMSKESNYKDDYQGMIDKPSGSNKITAADMAFCEEIIAKCKNDTLFLSEDSTQEGLAILRDKRPAVCEWLRQQFKDNTHHRVAVFDAAAKAKSKKTLTQRSTQRKTLIDFTKEMDLFQTPENLPYADVIVDGCRRTYQIGSEGFSRWLRKRYFDETGYAPNAESWSVAIESLKAQAEFSGQTREVFVRVGAHEGAIYLDLGNENFEVVEIRDSGWRLTTKPSVRFRRPDEMFAIPSPSEEGDVNLLRKYLNLKTESDFILVKAWLQAVLRGRGPYPNLIISGDFGGGKSTASEVLKSLVDPEHALSCRPPKNGDNLFKIAQDRQLLVFDNLSKLSNDLSDAFCLLLNEEGGYLSEGGKQKFFKASRPVIINSMEDLISRHDLADRSIFIGLERISDDKRMGTKEFWESFERDRPKILGGLLDEVVEGLRNIDEIRLPKLPRLADFVLWGSACECASDSQVMVQSALESNRISLVEDIVQSEPVANAVLLFMEEREVWEGPASELLEELLKVTDDRKNFSKQSNDLSRRLKLAKVFLGELGIEINFLKGRNKLISIRKKKQEDFVDSDGNSTVITEEDNFASVTDRDQSNSLPSPDNDISDAIKGDGEQSAKESSSGGNQPAQSYVEGNLALTASHSGHEKPYESIKETYVSEEEKSPASEEASTLKVFEEEVVSMQVSNSTIRVISPFKILGFLSGNGNELSIWDDTERFLVVVETPETFPEFRIFDLRKFLPVVDRCKDFDWIFTSNEILQFKKGKEMIAFSLGTNELSSHSANELKKMKWGADFDLNQVYIKLIKRWARPGRFMCISGDGEKAGIVFDIPNQKGKYTGCYGEINLGSTTQEFEICLDAKYLSKIPLGNYKVSVSMEGVTRFTLNNDRSNVQVTYYAFQEPEPETEPDNDDFYYDEMLDASESQDGILENDTYDGRTYYENIDEYLRSGREKEQPSVMHEEVKTVKVSQETLKIMSNFADIHNNLHLKGEELKIRNESETIIAFADIQESFPEFGLEKVKEFLTVVEKLSIFDWKFTGEKKWMDVSCEKESVCWNSEDLDNEHMFLKISTCRLEIPAPYAKFNIPWKTLNDLQQVTSNVEIASMDEGTGKVSFIGGGEQVSMKFKCGIMPTGGYSGVLTCILEPSREKFNVSFDKEIFNKLLPSDYEIGINVEGTLSFRRINEGDTNLIYYVKGEEEADNRIVIDYGGG